MYLICYTGTGNTICIKARCTTVDEITQIINEVRENEHRSSLQASQLFVLTSIIYPEKA